MKRLLGCAAQVAVLAVMTYLSTALHAQQVFKGAAQVGAAATGTEEPCILNPCLMYAGDFDIAGQNPNAFSNNNSLAFGPQGTVYVPFNVPRSFKGAKGKSDWSVQGLFANELIEFEGGSDAVESVSWSIVQGVASGGNPSGGQVKTICSGTGTPTSVTATGRSGFGLNEYTILLTGISCPTLEDGVYWMSFVPTIYGIAYLSDVEDNSPANTEGPGTEPIDESFVYFPSMGFPNFTAATTACGNIGCDAFSVGIIGTAAH